MTLPLKRQRFILELLADPKRNGKQAAIRAGYSEHSATFIASEILASKEVQDEISRQLRGYCQKLEIDAEQVIAGIRASIDDATKAGVGAWQMQARQRGWELLGRYLGMFKEQVDVSVDDKVIAQLHRGREYARRHGAIPLDDDNREEPETVQEESKKPN